VRFVALRFVTALQCAAQENKISRSIGLGLYWTVFKFEVPCRSSFGTSCILKKTRTDSLKVPVPLPINTASSNMQPVCLEMGLVLYQCCLLNGFG